MEGGSDRPGSEEVFLPLHVPRRELQPTTQFRSTWLVSSQNTLRSRGLFDRYLAALPDAHRDELSMTIVGSWLPIETARIHYQACDALGLTASEQIDIGRAVTKSVNQTLLSTAVRLATHSGATVWTPLTHFRRLWDRMFVGGGIIVYKLGPKDARIEILACTLVDIPYFRKGLEGVFIGIASLFSNRVYLRELPRLSSGSTALFRASWV